MRHSDLLQRMGIDEALGHSLSTLPWVAHYDKSIQLSAGSRHFPGGGFQIMGHLDAYAAADLSRLVSENCK